MTTEQAIEKYATQAAYKAGYKEDSRYIESYKYGVIRTVLVSLIDSPMTSHEALRKIKELKNQPDTLNVGPI